jgi:hypothetical protein
MFSIGGPRTNALKKQQECAVRRSRSKLYQLYRQVTLYVKCGLVEHHGSFRIILFGNRRRAQKIAGLALGVLFVIGGEVCCRIADFGREPRPHLPGPGDDGGCDAFAQPPASRAVMRQAG